MPLVQPLQRRCRAPEERSRAPFHLPSNRYENTANIPCPEPAPPFAAYLQGSREASAELRAAPAPRPPAAWGRGWEQGGSPIAAVVSPAALLCPTGGTDLPWKGATSDGPIHAHTADGLSKEPLFAKRTSASKAGRILPHASPADGWWWTARAVHVSPRRCCSRINIPSSTCPAPRGQRERAAANIGADPVELGEPRGAGAAPGSYSKWPF